MGLDMTVGPPTKQAPGRRHRALTSRAPDEIGKCPHALRMPGLYIGALAPRVGDANLGARIVIAQSRAPGWP